MFIDEETYLEHYGIKGMRWGQRKTRGRAGRVEKLNRLAERRPTRGNVRKAQRAEQNLNRRSNLTGKQKFARNVAVAGIGGAAVGVMVGKILTRSGGLSVSKARDIDVSMKAWDASGKLIKQVSSELSGQNARDLFGR